MGLAAAFKKKINGIGGGAPPSNGRSNAGPPKSTLRADAILEEEAPPTAEPNTAPTLPAGEPLPPLTPSEKPDKPAGV
jgi:hypothetical protein